jgi:hypothetical protein
MRIPKTLLAIMVIMSSLPVSIIAQTASITGTVTKPESQMNLGLLTLWREHPSSFVHSVAGQLCCGRRLW